MCALFDGGLSVSADTCATSRPEITLLTRTAEPGDLRLNLLAVETLRLNLLTVETLRLGHCLNSVVESVVIDFKALVCGWHEKQKTLCHLTHRGVLLLLDVALIWRSSRFLLLLSIPRPLLARSTVSLSVSCQIFSLIQGG